MPLPRSSFRTWFSRALQWIPRQRQNKHCSNRLQISDGDQLLHNHLVINPCPNRKAGETKLVSTGELLETWLRYRETTNKPLLFRRALRKASALRATLSWNLTCKNTSLKRENATEKGSIGKELLHRNRARLSQLTKLYLLFSNNWLTRQECLMASCIQQVVIISLRQGKRKEETATRLLPDRTETLPSICK